MITASTDQIGRMEENRMPRTVIHVLAVHKSETGQHKVTATIREGDASAGENVWFAATDGSHQEVQIVSRHDGRRHLTLELSGAATDLLRNGVYLYAD